MKIEHTKASNKKYLDGILNNDRLIMKEIYQQFFPGILNFVENNSGKRIDAEDVFQDALVSIFRRLKAGTLEIKHGFYTYLYAVCKRIWYKKLKKTNWNVTSDENLELSDSDENRITAAIERTEKYELFYSKLLQLGEDCQRVLKLHFAKKNFKEIAEAMQFKSEEYARRKKYLCKNELTKLIRADIRYKELTN